MSSLLQGSRVSFYCSTSAWLLLLLFAKHLISDIGMFRCFLTMKDALPTDYSLTVKLFYLSSCGTLSSEKNLALVGF